MEDMLCGATQQLQAGLVARAGPKTRPAAMCLTLSVPSLRVKLAHASGVSLSSTSDAAFASGGPSGPHSAFNSGPDVQQAGVHSGFPTEQGPVGSGARAGVSGGGGPTGQHEGAGGEARPASAVPLGRHRRGSMSSTQHGGSSASVHACACRGR